MRRSALVAAFALAAGTLAPAIGSAQGSAGFAAHASTSLNLPVQLAHIQIQVTTTSDWTDLSISHGYVAFSRVVHKTGVGTWQLQTAGVTLSDGAVSGSKSYRVDVLYVDTNNQPIVLKLTKGQLGTTTVVVRNLDAGDVVSRLVDKDRSTTTTTHPTSTEVPRQTFMGTSHAVLPRADHRKLVLAFYYPWYRSYRQHGIAERPRHPRSTYRRAGVSSMTAQAKSHGVNGFVVSWAGSGKDGKQFRLAVEAADRQHQVITGYLESVMATQGHLLQGEARELSWLVELLRYRHHKSFLKTSSGIPVVFVYSMDSLTTGQWHDLLMKLWNKHHLRVALVGDDPSGHYLPLEWGVHYYSATTSPAQLRAYSFNTSLQLKQHAALYGGSRPLFAAAVSPGYDDQRLRGGTNPVVPRDDGRRYLQTWRAALAGEPDWVLVTSWNEWFEDTAIEPGTRSGSGALRITRTESAAWKRS